MEEEEEDREEAKEEQEDESVEQLEDEDAASTSRALPSLKTSFIFWPQFISASSPIWSKSMNSSTSHLCWETTGGSRNSEASKLPPSEAGGDRDGGDGVGRGGGERRVISCL